MSACQPDCTCGKHDRSDMHNTLIGMSVARTAEAKGHSTTYNAIYCRTRRKP